MHVGLGAMPAGVYSGELPFYSRESVDSADSPEDCSADNPEDYSIGERPAMKPSLRTTMLYKVPTNKRIHAYDNASGTLYQVLVSFLKQKCLVVTNSDRILGV